MASRSRSTTRSRSAKKEQVPETEVVAPVEENAPEAMEATENDTGSDTPETGVDETPEVPESVIPVIEEEKTPETDSGSLTESERRAVTIKNMLSDYVSYMTPGKGVVSSHIGAPKQLELLRILSIPAKEATNQHDFNVMFDAVDEVFASNSGNSEALSKGNLMRFLDDVTPIWARRPESRDKYIVLTTIVTTLCNKETRKERLKEISFENAVKGAGMDAKTASMLEAHYKA